MKKLVLCIFIVLLVGAGCCNAWELRAEDAGFIEVAQSEGRSLLLNEKTMQLRLVDHETGISWNTCVMDGKQGNRNIKAVQKSALQATFISNARNATTTTFDSYSKSVETKTCTYTLIDNGVEIHYTIGDNTFIIDDLPKAIRADKYQRLQEEAGWSVNDAKKFKDNYRAVKLDGQEYEYMIRIKDDSLSAMVIKQVHAVIFSSGIYTEADMDEDNAVVNYEREYLPEVEVVVRYVLDGDDLVFSILCDQIDFTEENELIKLDVMPYFLSADTTQDGFIFVPDGCGALIYLNNGKAGVTAYEMPIYGRDALINADDYVTPREPVSLPVFGIKRTDSAMFAIVEQGAEMATLYANISGRSDEFNRINASFALREIENVSLAGNETVTSPRYSEDVYRGDIVIRYKWLIDETADVLTMAQAYRSHLLDKGLLKAVQKDENAPFFMEILGAAKKNKFFLGIPYASSVQATTIKQAEKIYDLAREAGIDNIRLMYSGLFYGGIKNAALSRLTLDGGVGSLNDLNKLSAHLHENGDTFYPAVYAGRVYTDRDFRALSQAARKHDGDPAKVYKFGEPVLKYAHNDHQGYYISPYYLQEYIDKVIRNLKPYQIDGLNLFDLGNTPVGDYKRRANINRIHTVPTYQEALASLGEEYKLLLDKPLLYAFAYADGATNLPDGDNGFGIADVSVPFLQWVLDGSMPYASSSWNRKSYLGMMPQLLWALESGSSPCFTFSWEDPSIFANTMDADYLANFSTQYEMYMGVAGEMYRTYNGFYRQVKDAEVCAYTVFSASVRKVEYDNGIILYVNYSNAPVQVDGVSIDAQNYLIQGGEAL